MRIRRLLAFVLIWALLGVPAQAQFKAPDPEGVQLGGELTQRWQAGIIVKASSGPCWDILATAPIPGDWPEQEVTIVEEDFTPNVKVAYGMAEGSVQQMVIRVPSLRYGEQARAVVTLEVRRKSQIAPADTSIYSVAERRKLPRGVLSYLALSPGIECTSAKIKSLVKQFDGEHSNDWARVEAIYDWVRENVEHKEGFQGGALACLQGGHGDHEDLTSLFIALCRADGIPARTVWVKGHCYPEFYLVDAEGTGHWFPCQAGGARAFGEMPDHRPIIEKGDSFPSPNNPRERKRFLAETLSLKGSKPQKQFIRGTVAQ